MEAWNNPVSPGESFKIEYTLASTLGNKNFFSETLLMLFPFSLASVWMLNSTWKWLSVMTSALIIIEIIFLRTTSALAGLVAGFISVLIIFLFLNSKSRKFLLSMKGLTVIVIVFGMGVFELTKTQLYKDFILKVKQTTSTFNKDAS